MNIFQLECFISVSDNLSFARASEEMHVSQPAITMQIQSLEKELGVKLFKRTTRLVKLTNEGLIFLNDARNIVGISKRAIRRFESPDEGRLHFLSLGSYNLPNFLYIAPILNHLNHDINNFRPILRFVPFRQIFRLLIDGDLDIILGFKENDTLNYKVNYLELTKVNIVCVMSKDNPLADLKEVSLTDLKKESVVLCGPNSQRQDATHLHSVIGEDKPVSKICYAENIEALITLIKAGLGISVLPDNLVSEEFNLCKIPLKNTKKLSFGIYYKSINDNPLIKNFIDLAKELL